MTTERHGHRPKPGVADIFRNEATAWVVLAISLVVTALAWHFTNKNVQRHADDSFRFEAEDAGQHIVKRLLNYEQVLRSGVALMQTGGTPVTRNEWRRYVEGLHLRTEFPGIQRIGYAAMLSPDQLPAHVAAIRAEGFPDYRVWPNGKRNEYSTTVYLAPLDRRAFGYDMFSDPVRHAAMVLARDTGLPAVSGRITTVAETRKEAQTGFLVYIPVYRPGLPTATVAQRRKALAGFVYCPFRVKDLMRGILGDTPAELDFQLYDGTGEPGPGNFLYDSAPNDPYRRVAHHRLTTTLNLPGHTWTARFFSRPAFDRTTGSNQPALIGLVGLAVDLLLFISIWTLVGERKRVHAKAAAMTADLRATTDRLQLAQTEFSHSEERLRLAASVFDHAHEGIAITDAQERIIEVNPTFVELTGYSREEVIGRTPRQLKSGRHDGTFYAEMWARLKRDGFWRGEIWNRRKNGEVYPELLTISAVYGPGREVTHYVGVFSDISLLKDHQYRLERLAQYDALTQLPNRTLLADRMQQAMAHARRSKHLLAVCYLDLDGFKPVNDAHGHDAGDQLLIKVSERLNEHLRGGDSVARLGGDEFVLLLGGMENIEECSRALGRLLQAISTPYPVGHGRSVAISASIGVTLYPSDESDADTLLRHADQAMYLAKQAGRNRYYLFDPEHDRLTQAHHEALTRIEEALETNEFLLYYQPRVDMRLGEVTGAEALIRWQHPERGLLPPAEFLPVVEENDFACRLGDWVINEALEQMTAWRREGLDIQVSVNISGRHFQRPGFTRRLGELLAAHPEVPAGNLELEVLETTALEDINLVIQVIDECRELGVSIALDDFGTGYSSLTYLKRLPADTLKIDQSFVRDMLTDPDDLAIIEGIIGLTQAFRRQVVAEGVETEEHGELLLRLGCDLAQGYGIARPMPAGQVVDWVRGYTQPPKWSEVADVYWLREDLPLLSAELEHRRWVEDLALALGPGNDTLPPPPMDVHACRFGQWYDGPGRARYGKLQQFASIAPLHKRIHTLAHELVWLAQSGNRDEAQRRLPELLALRDEIFTRLRALQTTLADRTASE